jgi:hypothetical protein
MMRASPAEPDVGKHMYGPIDDLGLKATVAHVLDRWLSAGLAIAVIRDGQPSRVSTGTASPMSRRRGRSLRTPSSASDRSPRPSPRSPWCSCGSKGWWRRTGGGAAAHLAARNHQRGELLPPAGATPGRGGIRLPSEPVLCRLGVGALGTDLPVRPAAPVTSTLPVTTGSSSAGTLTPVRSSSSGSMSNASRPV